MSGKAFSIAVLNVSRSHSLCLSLSRLWLGGSDPLNSAFLDGANCTASTPHSGFGTHLEMTLPAARALTLLAHVPRKGMPQPSRPSQQHSTPACARAPRLASSHHMPARRTHAIGLWVARNTARELPCDTGIAKHGRGVSCSNQLGVLRGLREARLFGPV